MSQTRRKFLASSAGAAAAAAAAPLSATAYRRIVGANERVRIGIIGTGGMGGGHMHSFLGFRAKERANVDVVALADVCKTRVQRAQQAAREKQPDVEVKAYQQYSDLLARDDLHGVLIASPEHWHAKMAIDALDAGKDVYLEKPMTLNLAHALELAKTKEKHPDRILQVGTQKMALSKYREARALIADNAIGKPVWSQTSYCRNSKDGEWNYYRIEEDIVPGETIDWDAWCGPMGTRPWDPLIYHRWRRYKDFSTGIIGDLLVHEMTPLLYALGDTAGWPVRVDAIGGHYIDKAMENHDQVNLTVQFEKEHTMVVAGSTANEQGLETMIRGHEATLYLGGNNVVVRPERIYADDRDEMDVECERIHDQDMLRLNWLSCIQSREPNFSQIDMGLKIMVIVDLATRSMWEGKAFAFDPQSMESRAI